MTPATVELLPRLCHNTSRTSGKSSPTVPKHLVLIPPHRKVDIKSKQVVKDHAVVKIHTSAGNSE